jgi:hypothetical protein
MEQGQTAESPATTTSVCPDTVWKGPNRIVLAKARTMLRAAGFIAILRIAEHRSPQVPRFYSSADGRANTN